MNGADNPPATQRLRWQVPDDRLTEIVRGPTSEAGAMATELRDLRTASRTDKKHVGDVVRDVVLEVALIGPKLSTQTLQMLAAAIADRAAERLAAPPEREMDRIRAAVREACQRFGYTLRVPDIDAIVERVTANLSRGGVL